MSEALKILVLDDDVDLAESLADILEIEGHSVTMVHDGPAAIEAFKREDFDVGFFDVKMPGMNGVESFLEIKKMKPHANVFMMTGFSVEQLLEQALDNGALGVLNKPFDIEELVSKLDAVQSGLIVVADDDPDLVESIVPVLQGHGYVVATAQNGQEAIDLVMNNTVDLLILDLNMPILSGLEVYMELKSRGREVRTLIITGQTAESAGAIDELRSYSVTGVLNKPFDPEELLCAIEDRAA